MAGARTPAEETSFTGSLNLLAQMAGRGHPGASPGENTVIGVVATNAPLTKEQANKLAQMAQNGIARTVRPAHSMFDGDTIFALGAPPQAAPLSPLEVSLLGELAAESTARAIVNAVLAAESTAGIPAAKDL